MDYKDQKLSAEERAEALLAEMSLEEKMGQIVGYCPADWSSDDLERDYPHGAGQVSMLDALDRRSITEVRENVKKIQTEIMELSEHHIPAFFHAETLCGVMIPEAVSFPSGIGQASTWNPELEKDMGKIIGRQARAVGATHVFAPVLDISRDSRMGRQGETYGEDPTLASAMGTAYVQGIQADGDGKKGIIACAKHFLGYQGATGGMHASAAHIPDRTLREIYAKPFQAAITEGGLCSVMNSYGSMDGEPASSSDALLKKLLCDEMGFEGLLVSDYSSISEQFERQKIGKSLAHAGKVALEAGIVQELPTKKCYNDEMMEWFRTGEVPIELLDHAVKKILEFKFRVGLFEDPFFPEEEEAKLAFSYPHNQEISKKMAKESLILIKNDGILPLKKEKRKVAVIGYHAAASRAFFGGYTFISMIEKFAGAQNTMAGVDINGDKTYDMEEIMKDPELIQRLIAMYCKFYPGSHVNVEGDGLEELIKAYLPQMKNLLEQLREDWPEAEITYAYGYPYVGNDLSYHEEALQTVKDAEVVLMIVGGKYGWGSAASTGEGIDSTDINLPICQEELIKKVGKMGKPMVVVHFDGRPISSDAADEYANAILEAWSPAEFGAEAITSVLLGSYNPCGRLPVSVAYTSGQIPVFYNHENGSSYHIGTKSYQSDYIDRPHAPRYFFGHGLSYTTFDYKNLVVNKKEVLPSDEIELKVSIQNTGDMAGFEVVQIYASNEYKSVVRPVKELVGFKKVFLKMGEQKTVSFTLKASQLAFLDRGMKWKVEKGTLKFLAGKSSEDIKLEESIDIIEDAFIDGKNRGFVAKAEIE